MLGLPSVATVATAAANLFDATVPGGLADLRRMPATVIDRGAPAPLVKRGYQLAGVDKYLMKPWTMLSNLEDRDLLAQIEAVDEFMDHMHAYPGRTFGQLYHHVLRTNAARDGAGRSPRCSPAAPRAAPRG